MNTSRCVGRNCNGVSEGSVSRRVKGTGIRFCRACLCEIKARLKELPELYDDCESALVTARRPHTLQRVNGKRRPTGILLDEDVVTARSNILSILACWSALVADERSVRKPRRTPEELTAFLLKHLSWLLEHPAADDFAEEILELVRETRRSAYMQSSMRFHLGSCVHTGCHAAMQPLPARDGKGTREVRCAAGHTWKPHEWLELSFRIRQDREAGKN